MFEAPQHYSELKASTIKVSNMKPVYPAAHGSRATVHLDSKTQFHLISLECLIQWSYLCPLGEAEYSTVCNAIWH